MRERLPLGGTSRLVTKRASVLVERFPHQIKTEISIRESSGSSHGYFNFLERLKHCRIVISANKRRLNTVHKCGVNVAPW